MKDEIKKSVQDFRKSIIPIIDSSALGIKGKCSIEGKLSSAKKFKFKF